MTTIRLYEPGEVPTALLSNVLPSPIGPSANAGISTFAARADHNHDDSALRAYVETAVDVINTKVSLYEVEVDFGSTAIRSKKFTVSMPGLVIGDGIAIALSGNAATGRKSDESEMEEFTCVGRCVATGVLTFIAKSLAGPVKGRYKFSIMF